ncbi:MAG: type VI secretion system baseplate subunit TssG [Phycisphaerales bacterium]
MAGEYRTTTGSVAPAPNGAVHDDPLDAILAAAGETTPTPDLHRPVAPTREPNYEAREALWDKLNVEPWSCDFYALVRRIEALHQDQPGFGYSSRASEDPVRFGQKASMAFPPCTVSEFQFPRGNAPARLFVNFMGMLGPMGPLPLHITEYAYQREEQQRDRTLASFVNVFNHRMVGLFYRAWAASQMTASFDRSPRQVPAEQMGDAERTQVLAADQDRYATYIGSFFGMGTQAMRYRDAAPDAAKLHFAGRLSMATRGPEGLRAILATYLGVEVEIEEFAGRWVELPEQYRCKLGGVGASLGTLSGGGAVAGTKVWDAQGAFRIRLGPMSLKRYQSLLPGSLSARRLDAWIRNYLGDEFYWEVSLILKASEVPVARLGGNPAAGARMGWTSWVTTAGSEEDRCDLMLRSKR